MPKYPSQIGRIPGHFVADWIELLLILFLPLSRVHLMRCIAVSGLWLWRFPILLPFVGRRESWWFCAVRTGTAGRSISVNTPRMNWTKSWMGWMKVSTGTWFLILLLCSFCTLGVAAFTMALTSFAQAAEAVGWDISLREADNGLQTCFFLLFLLLVLNKKLP